MAEETKETKKVISKEKKPKKKKKKRKDSFKDLHCFSSSGGYRLVHHRNESHEAEGRG